MSIVNVPRQVNIRAVRAFNRVWKPISKNLVYAECCDAGFDGGEFSGPAHRRLFEAQYECVLTKVAIRFGMVAQDLERDVEQAHHNEFFSFISSQEVRAQS